MIRRAIVDKEAFTVAAKLAFIADIDEVAREGGRVGRVTSTLDLSLSEEFEG